MSKLFILLKKKKKQASKQIKKPTTFKREKWYLSPKELPPALFAVHHPPQPILPWAAIDLLSITVEHHFVESHINMHSL